MSPLYSRTAHLTRDAILGGALLMLAVAGAPARAADDALPTGDEVVGKFVEAIGGEAKLSKFENRIATGTVELATMQAKGPITIYEAAPNKLYSLAEISGVGKIESGCDGQVRWENTAMTGPRLLDGDEKAIADRLSAFDATIHWKKYYESAKTTAIEDVDGKLHYRVVLTPKVGPPVTAFYDRKTFLQTKVALTMKSPMGEVPLEIVFDEYREVDGVLLPHKQITRGPGIENIVTLRSIKHNVSMPNDRFALPDAIVALAQRAAQHEKATSTAPAKKP